MCVPRVGSLHHMAQDFCARTGIGFVEPPEYTTSTIERGVAVSPEHFCFPMKVLMGSAMECLDAGADTLVTVAGYGACRFNYFAELQRRLLEREGYTFDIVAFDSPRDSVSDFYENFRTVTRAAGLSFRQGVRAISLTLQKGRAFDLISKKALSIRTFEAIDGATDRAVAECREMLAPVASVEELKRVNPEIDSVLEAVEVDSGRPHLKIGVTGEIMTAIEPYFNLDIEHWLARRGALMERSIYMSDLFSPMGKNPVKGWTDAEMESIAAPYLYHEIGGHGQINVAAVVDFARQGYDAVVHLMPFTCLPEVIARTLFTRMSEDLDMPILSISIDEQTGRAGMETRMEALMDLAWSRKRVREGAASIRRAG
jgi:predicted nucleotide-binding protein (sugar kinase/HSP70/actin superfamily)